MKKAALLFLAAAPLFAGVQTAAQEDAKRLEAIAWGIADLRPEFPQLKDFSPEKNLKPEQRAIDYAYHTHKAPRGGGWTAGVPNPDEDGVWFYINVHDPSSIAQIDTQPSNPAPLCLGKNHVTFLLLEGTKTKPMGERLGKLLRDNGIGPCDSAETASGSLLVQPLDKKDVPEECRCELYLAKDPQHNWTDRQTFAVKLLTEGAPYQVKVNGRTHALALKSPEQTQSSHKLGETFTESCADGDLRATIHYTASKVCDASGGEGCESNEYKAVLDVNQGRRSSTLSSLSAFCGC